MEFLATKQGEGGPGIKNTAKSASPGGLWAVYWFGLVTILITILFAYESWVDTWYSLPGGREIAPFG